MTYSFLGNKYVLVIKQIKYIMLDSCQYCGLFSVSGAYHMSHCIYM